MSVYRWTRATYAIAIRHPVNLLVYQMGKVGSTSVQRSLYEVGLRPLHVHFIHSDLTHMERFTETERDFPLHFYIGCVLRHYLNLTTNKVKVITLVRDPVARYVSAQFQTLDHEPIARDDPDRAVQQLQDEIRDGGKVRFDWFEREMEPFLGVNPIYEPFDREEGYAIIQAPRAEVLVLKLERLSDLIPGVVSDFVGRDLSVVTANRGSEKEYAEYYQEVRQRLSLSEETCEDIYGHDHVTHFYTSEEANTFAKKWQ